MSAPDTNIDKQTKRHRSSIVGIIIALFLGVAIGLLIASATDVNGPQVMETGALERADLHETQG